MSAQEEDLNENQSIWRTVTDYGRWISCLLRNVAAQNNLRSS